MQLYSSSVLTISIVCFLSISLCSTLASKREQQSSSKNTTKSATSGQFLERSHLDDISSNVEEFQSKRPARGFSGMPQLDTITRDGDTRVPFWNIAHMINSVAQIRVALDAGSNAIETDVSFNKQGSPVETYHGIPCDCGRHCLFRENFVQFIRHLGSISTPPASSRLQLVLFDLKLKDLKLEEQLKTAGKQLATILNEHLYSAYLSANRQLDNKRPPLRVILSINYAKDLALVKAFIEHMRMNQLDFMSQQVGFDVGMNDNLKNISSMWDSLNGATLNIWQGDGLTNCANLVRGVERLKEAISMRNNQGHFRKVYYWTADILYHIRSVMRLGLDAVLTNQPQRVLQVLEEPEFKPRYRLATPYDNPFEQFWIQPTAWQMSPPSLSEAIETVENIKKTSSDFIKTLPDGIGAAIKKVHATFV